MPQDFVKQKAKTLCPFRRIERKLKQNNGSITDGSHVIFQSCLEGKCAWFDFASRRCGLVSQNQKGRNKLFE